MTKLRVFFRFPVSLFLFWMLLFTGFRLWFILYFPEKWQSSGRDSIWAAFYHALPLDLSMAAYLLVVPVLLWYLSAWAKPAIQKRLLRWSDLATQVELFVMVPVFGANIFLYAEWHTMLNSRAFSYLKTPAALFDSLSWGFFFVLAALYVLVFLVMRLGYRRLAHPIQPPPKSATWAGALVPSQMAVLFLCIRGGLGGMPVNESAVYYASELFYNHAATNPGWHFLHSLIEKKAESNPFRFADAAAADERVQRMLEASNDPAPAPWLQCDSLKKPNVVLVVMESMTAQVVESLGGKPGVCPSLERLAAEGILFEQCYSSGYRTDQGIVSILSGFPAQPDQSIILQEEKAVKLPSLPRIIKGNGYQTGFLYGGELTFANMGLWLSNQGFEKILSQADFPAEAVRQRWGADDATALQRSLKEIGALQQPFFWTTLTLSLHPPFDVPYQSRFNGPGEPEQFMNSAAFADDAIGRFVEAAQREPWFENTLFIFVADHGNGMPGRLGQDQWQARQVPLIFWGPALNPAWKGKRVGIAGNHHDIMGTLLPALGYSNPMPWSRNLLPQKATSNSFAYYTYEDGMGWVTRDEVSFFSFVDKGWTLQKGEPNPDARADAEAFLQMLYEDYLRY